MKKGKAEGRRDERKKKKKEKGKEKKGRAKERKGRLRNVYRSGASIRKVQESVSF